MDTELQLKICCGQSSVDCLCVCLFVETMSRTRMAKPIVMPFGVWRLGAQETVY